MKNSWPVLLFIAIIGCSCVYKQKENTQSKDDLRNNNYFIKDILKDGAGDFDPWNTKRWKAWYNKKGELIHPFDIDTTVIFKHREKTWEIPYSKDFDNKAFFVITQPGISINGNKVILDVRTEKQKLPLDELFALKKEPWNEGCEIIGILYDLPQMEKTQATAINNITFMGFKRGIKINGSGNDEQHRLIIEDCIFTRNRIGFYTNGYNTLIQNCQLFENGYGAIYSGSKSRRNQFVNNIFRDNTLSQHQASYGDFIGDTFFDSEIRNNKFLKSQIKSDFRRIGISMFRNMGESNRLRPQMPHNNIIRGNSFNRYSVAINIGGRMGRNTRNDITGEGRDYAFYNLIDSNYIENSAIGIKINTEGNTISANTFRNVADDIVLHCVFFKLENTTINNQKGNKVRLWFVKEDYTKYAKWFQFQDDLNGSIKKSEKRIEVFTEKGSPDFPENNNELFVLNPEKRDKTDRFTDFRIGQSTQILSGEFSLDLPGKEMVAIWDKPVSRINETDYYSILIFDDKGTEINRCGRSEVKWKQIAAGYFIRKDGEMEIAAIRDEPLDGKFPVFIFDRGFKEPKEIRYQNNTDPKIEISTDENLNLIVTF